MFLVSSTIKKRKPSFCELELVEIFEKGTTTSQEDMYSSEFGAGNPTTLNVNRAHSENFLQSNVINNHTKKNSSRFSLLDPFKQVDFNSTSLFDTITDNSPKTMTLPLSKINKNADINSILEDKPPKLISISTLDYSTSINNIPIPVNLISQIETELFNEEFQFKRGHNYFYESDTGFVGIEGKVWLGTCWPENLEILEIFKNVSILHRPFEISEEIKSFTTFSSTSPSSGSLKFKSQLSKQNKSQPVNRNTNKYNSNFNFKFLINEKPIRIEVLTYFQKNLNLLNSVKSKTYGGKFLIDVGGNMYKIVKENKNEAEDKLIYFCNWKDRRDNLKCLGLCW
ncbi:hypothetical protein HK099_003969 [Clydaea vesicula]|uniref:Uncharacterized protein n=1 Tax=Clydaea vesicula TaxID=447962 RepID=A0AAD5U878_9FUNG|nr:hypothetical protein HK099_003969 [Clydaea vesicula]KAJ3394375.1 hypothetical protein HDU92_006954 [Lobulomyces angularis]